MAEEHSDRLVLIELYVRIGPDYRLPLDSTRNLLGLIIGSLEQVRAADSLVGHISEHDAAISVHISRKRVGELHSALPEGIEILSDELDAAYYCGCQPIYEASLVCAHHNIIR